MSAVDPWPQAPILSELPPTARLAVTFDLGRLLADVARIRVTNWKEIRIVSGDGLGDYATKLDWRTIPLRSIGGDGNRGDAGGPDLADFADTPWLAQLPYLAEVLAAIPGRLAAARLMALGPGASIPVHSDSKCGLPWGRVRLHVPIVTMPEAALFIADERHCWGAGEVWYADFTRGHTVSNTGTRTRVHLVVDVYVTPELLALFPAEFRTGAVRDGSMFEPPDVPLPAAQADQLRCGFGLPRSFRSWEEPDGEFLRDQPTTAAAVDAYNGGVALYLSDEPAFGLVHVGAGEFRFAGWTAERTIQPSRSAAGELSVTLRSRVGSRVNARTIPAAPITDRPKPGAAPERAGAAVTARAGMS
ncbi:MAG TPA: aspartyl/asparaginyl beta-hydroxylase domain-containing protein [Streptosporangiaceae bacterium]|nr:aspartyl/asparaginyl beta-hydroxylase domain-containing protein [Streptosporangiaceae bacterium]